MVRKGLWVLVCVFLLSSQGSYAGFSLCFWKKKEVWKTATQLADSKDYMAIQELASQVPPRVQEEHRARLGAFLEKAQSKDGLSPRDWFTFVEHSTYELRDFVNKFTFGKKADKLKINVANQDKVSYRGGWFRSRKLVFPKKIESSEKLAHLLFNLTQKARDYDLREIRRRSRSFWRPDLFYLKRYEILRALESDINLNKPLRDAELLIRYSLMDMPVPESMLRTVENARNRVRELESQSIRFSMEENPYVAIPRQIEAGYWRSQRNPRNWLAYVKDKWLSIVLMIFLFYQFEEETPDDDMANFGGVVDTSGEGPEGHRFLEHTTGTITREMIYRAEDGSRRVKLQFEKPDGSEILSFDLGQYYRVRDPESGATISRGVQLEPALMEGYETVVEEIIRNRFRGESWFENMAHASQTRYLSYALGKRLGLWVYFSTLMQDFGLTYDNLVFHHHEWSPDQVREHFSALGEDPNHELPSFLLGLNKELWRELANPPVNPESSEEEQAAERQRRRAANMELFDEMLMQYELVAERPIFAFIRETMEEDMSAYESSQTYDTSKNALSVIATFFVASKASIMGRALTSAGIVPTSFGATALVATPNILDSTFEGIEGGFDQQFLDQDAYVMMWQDEYRTFLSRLDTVTQNTSLQELPLVQFLADERVQRSIRIPQLRATGQRLALLTKPEIQEKIRQCRTQPDDFLTGLESIEVQSEIEGFMRTALSYPTICELLVLTTFGGEIKGENDQQKSLESLLLKIVVHAPSPGLQNELSNVEGNSAVGAFNGEEKLLEIFPRQGWSEHVKFYVLAEELWHGFFDQRVANQMKRYPSKRQFVQACALHEYVAHLLQLYLLKEIEDPGVPIVLWVSSTSHTLGRIWDDSSRAGSIRERIEAAEANGEPPPQIDPSELQGTYETNRLMHMLDIMSDEFNHSMMYQFYRQQYESYYDTR